MKIRFRNKSWLPFLSSLPRFGRFTNFFFSLQINNIYIYIFFADLWYPETMWYAPEYFAEWSFRQWSSEWSNFVCRDEKGTGRGKRKRRPLRKWVSCSAKFETGLGKTAIDFFPPPLFFSYSANSFNGPFFLSFFLFLWD